MKELGDVNVQLWSVWAGLGSQARIWIGFGSQSGNLGLSFSEPDGQFPELAAGTALVADPCITALTRV